MAYFIFDLDHTVIDSSHRQNTLPDGSLDLAHWFENNTTEKILADKLLPLADVMRTIKLCGHKVLVCTARSPHKANHLFMLVNNLKYDTWLGRPENCFSGDAELKIGLLENYFKAEGFNSVAEARPIMYDDNDKVIVAMRQLGVNCYDSKLVNAQLLAA